MADNNTIARPYARAVFELANENGHLAEWSAALTTAQQVMADGRVAKFLGNPSLTDEQRLGFLTETIAAAGDKRSSSRARTSRARNFLRLLLEYGRVSVLPEIAQHFEALKAAVENTVDVTVTSASELSAAQRQTIAAALKERLGRDVNMCDRN